MKQFYWMAYDTIFPVFNYIRNFYEIVLTTCKIPNINMRNWWPSLYVDLDKTKAYLTKPR